MATALSPKTAARCAQGVYELRTTPNMERAIGVNPSLRELNAQGEFELVGGSRLVGHSGNMFHGANSGFGFIAAGKGFRRGEVLLVFRGTEFTFIPDWLSNVNFSSTGGPGGAGVHHGFHQVYASMAPTVMPAIAALRPTMVHVVGHSLGGAIATLAAGYLKAAGTPAKLYTFGQPRVALGGSSQTLTRLIGASNIYRVAHMHDPVPMVPVYPYAHMPYGDIGYHMRGVGERIDPAAHGMAEYIRSVGNLTWSGLPIYTPDPGSLDQAEAWLSAAARSSGTVGMMSASALHMIVACVDEILEAAGDICGVGVFGFATIIDRLCMLLQRGIQMGTFMAAVIEKAIRAVMRVLGRTVHEGVRMTAQFVRFVVDLLLASISSMATRAINLIA